MDPLKENEEDQADWPTELIQDAEVDPLAGDAGDPLSADPLIPDSTDAGPSEPLPQLNDINETNKIDALKVDNNAENYESGTLPIADKMSSFSEIVNDNEGTSGVGEISDTKSMKTESSLEERQGNNGAVINCERTSFSDSPATIEHSNTDTGQGEGGSVSENVESFSENNEDSKDKEKNSCTNKDSDGISEKAKTHSDSGMDEGDSDREAKKGGSDGEDEDEDHKTKRLKAKRRHVSGSSDMAAPAPKMKRKSKTGSDDEKEGDKEQKKKKDDKSSGDEDDSDEEEKKLRLQRRTGLSAKPKVKNLRRNIRDIISDDRLEEDTLAAQKEEQLRLQRLQEKRNALREYLEQQEVERLVAEVSKVAEVAEVSGTLDDESEVQLGPVAPSDDSDIVVLSSEEDAPRLNKNVEEGGYIIEDDDLKADEEFKVKEEVEGFEDDEIEEELGEEELGEEEEITEEKEVKIKQEKVDSDKEEEVAKLSGDEGEKSGSDSDVVILSEHSDDEDADIEDTTSSGAHINDAFNIPDAQGRVLVNVGHPEEEEDIFLAPQLAKHVKPHQIGGIRFLYDNIIESIEQFKSSNGFGCILAHSMGLGKTLQVVAFSDVFLRHTESKSILIIVPINTIQNWLSEYNNWLPEGNAPIITPDGQEVWPRKFKVFVLNDALKNLTQRARVIREWNEVGGVLLMGYELYRQLSLKKPKKPKKKKKKLADNSEVVDIEEEDKNKELLDEIQTALVKPGPDLVICDEGHRIKNAHANISQALKNIRTKRRVVLTGYPLQNNLLEYWCMVDFVRPNYLGTKTEFSNMFERPIQNGQCVDSTPQDKKLMRYRSHVLHSLLEGFVQRRGHTVLAMTLPKKEEHVLLCRLTEIQRKLYSTFMAELAATKALANPLKAFAICCKIWNHPDVLYNFVQKKINEDFDLDLDDLENKTKLRRGANMNTPNSSGVNVPSLPTPSWATPGGQVGRNMMSQHQGVGPNLGMGGPQGGLNPQVSPMGQPMNMNQQQQQQQQQNPMGLQQGNMGFHDPMGMSMMHHGMGQHRDNQGGMGNYGMGGHNVHQNYGMQMPPYPWYNQGYGNNDPNRSHYPPPPPYNNPYANQYQHNTPVSQSLPPGYPPNMHNSQMGMQHNNPIGQPLDLNNSQGQPMDLVNQMGQNPMGMPNQPGSLNLARQPMGMANHTGAQQQQLGGMQNHSGQIPTSQALDGLNLSGQGMGVPSSSGQSIDNHNSSEQNQSMGVPNMMGQSMGGPNPNNQSMGSMNMSGGGVDNTSGMSNLGEQQLPMGGGPGIGPSKSGLSMGGQNPLGMTNSMGSNMNDPMAMSNHLGQNMGTNPGEHQVGMGNLGGPNGGSQMNSMNSSGQNMLINNSPGQAGNQSGQIGGTSPYMSGANSQSMMNDNSPTTPATPATPATPSTSAPATPSGLDDKVKKEAGAMKSEPGSIKELGEEDEEIKKEETKEGEESEDKKEEKKEEGKKEEMTLEWTEGLFKDYIPGTLTASAKFQIFFRIVDGSVRIGDKILVFSQSLFTLSLLEEFLQRSYIPGTFEGWMRNRSYFRLDGSTTAQEREKLINEFNINPNVRLFLVSTRAGSLGINLVGANRVIVFDASFNPCHDTQAVCRVYRYGQKKECQIYRFVTDNSLEKRIYDRQVNKQGMADRIVDEMNPDAHLSSKEISNLLVENESDPDPVDLSDKVEKYKDPVLQEVVRHHSKLFTKAPFRHDSLLVDRKDKKLSRAEKRLAKRSYELEKQANISYSRPSYAAFYPKNQQGQVIMGTKIGGVMYSKPVGTVRPLQAEMGHRLEGGGIIHRPNILSRSHSSFPVEALAKQGVSVQQITVPKEVSIPTNSGDGKPILLKAGQSVMVIKTQKGIYLRLADGKIVAIRVPPGNEEVFGLPLNKGSVTIVPTIVNSPRPTMRGRGRRGRPPMAVQYATGNLITKGQMPVRIMKKPGRGGRAYQSIVVPVSTARGTTPQALLNKSVVITPAIKSGLSSTAKAVRNLKMNPKVTVTATTKASSSGSNISSIVTPKITISPTIKSLDGSTSTGSNLEVSTGLPGTSGVGKITKRVTLSQLAKLRKVSEIKKEPKSETSDKTPEETKTSETSKEEPPAEGTGEKDTTEEDGTKGQSQESESFNLMSMESMENSSKDPSMTDDLDDMPTSPSDNEMPDDLGTPGQNDQSSTGPLKIPEFNQGTENKSANVKASSISQNVEQSGAMGKNNISDSFALGPKGSNSMNHSETSSSSSSLNDMGLGNQQRSGFGMRDVTKPLPTSVTSGSDNRTGIVKPNVHDTSNKPTAALTPLQSMSNLLPPDGPGPPDTTTSTSLSSSNVSSFSSQTFQSSQPLFQPFLQPTHHEQQQSSGISSSNNSINNNSSITTNSSGSSSSVNSSWSKGNSAVSSASLGSNVAQVAPHVHQSGGVTSSASTFTSQSSFLTTSQAQFSGSTGSFGSISGVSTPSTQQESTPSYPSISASPQISQQPQQQQQQQQQQSPQSSISSTLSHAGSGLVPTSRSGGLGGPDSPLSLSHLLNSQVFDSGAVPEDLSSPHSHASALDYLNYTLSSGTSAFRRPDYQSALSPDLQSLITSATSQQPLASSLPSAAAANPAATSPSPFPSYQPPTYSQYASPYRAGTSVSPSPYAAYAAGQYPSYATQYPPSLAPHAAAAAAAAAAASAAQPPTMGQYGALHAPPNPYQTYPTPPTTGRSPYSSTLGSFSHGPYPPM